jgi:hypothetical protein
MKRIGDHSEAISSLVNDWEGRVFLCHFIVAEAQLAQLLGNDIFDEGKPPQEGVDEDGFITTDTEEILAAAESKKGVFDFVRKKKLRGFAKRLEEKLNNLVANYLGDSAAE